MYSYVIVPGMGGITCALLILQTLFSNSVLDWSYITYSKIRILAKGILIEIQLQFPDLIKGEGIR